MHSGKDFGEYMVMPMVFIYVPIIYRSTHDERARKEIHDAPEQYSGTKSAGSDDEEHLSPSRVGMPKLPRTYSFYEKSNMKHVKEEKEPDLERKGIFSSLSLPYLHTLHTQPLITNIYFTAEPDEPEEQEMDSEVEMKTETDTESESESDNESEEEEKFESMELFKEVDHCKIERNKNLPVHVLIQYCYMVNGGTLPKNIIESLAEQFHFIYVESTKERSSFKDHSYESPKLGNVLIKEQQRSVKIKKEKGKKNAEGGVFSIDSWTKRAGDKEEKERSHLFSHHHIITSSHHHIITHTVIDGCFFLWW